jgi:hypothetical protein
MLAEPGVYPAVNYILFQVPGILMKIMGIDFTSAPSARKPISCAVASLHGGMLVFHELKDVRTFQEFDALLCGCPPWVAGIDFPFGQSRRLLSNLGWPLKWESYVGRVAGMSKADFVRTLEEYKADRPPGDKEHKREIDRLASSISPQKLYGVPVGKMFFEGAPRLLSSPASIIPHRPTQDARVIFEAYPAIVARRYIGRRSYKNDTPAKQTPQLRDARLEIVQGIRSQGFSDEFGFHIDLPDALETMCVDDAAGDYLDALLCCLQAAWAWLQRDNRYGMPENVDNLEGWIADPLFADHG